MQLITKDQNKEKKSIEVSIVGDIDLYSSPKLKRSLKEFVSDDMTHIVVDFKSTTYIDGSGIGIFIDLKKELQTLNGKLVFTNISESVFKVIKLTNLTGYFEIK